MTFDLIRDSTVGQIINYVSRGRLLPYADQRAGYVVPTRFLTPANRNIKEIGSADATTLCEGPETKKRSATVELDQTKALTTDEAFETVPPDGTPGLFLVDWEEDDPDNPQNWSFKKRAFVALSMSLLTFSVYIGSAIYTSSIPGLMLQFDVSLTVATLGLSLYVLGYGVGPMFLTPLQELPLLGRNPVYMVTLLLFVVCQVPIITAKNISTVLALRFVTGFLGSPALATGGATISDIFPDSQVPYALAVWGFGGVGGPIVGPVIGGFAAQAESWRWPMLELLWISGFALAFLVLLLPETNAPTILLRRARRLRALTGNAALRTATERAEEVDADRARERMYEALVRPFTLSPEPVLMFANVYLGFVYAIFYLWFEAFPLVFFDIYHFNEGIGGLPYLGFLVSGAFAYASYCLYQMYRIAPLSARAAAANKPLAPEIKLEIGVIASLCIPASVLIFGFASKASVPWIAPVIGAALYMPGIYLVFQSILNYVTTAYPDHQAPVLAANALFRSAIASVFPCSSGALSSRTWGSVLDRRYLRAYLSS